jgi:hypothetical protein
MCKITAAQIQADGLAVGNAILQIANAIKATDPTLSAELTTAANGLIAATANWQEGSATAILEDAENAVIVALNLIPLTSPYAPLVAIAFAALNILLANTMTQPAQAAASSLSRVSIVTHMAESNPSHSPWYGQAKISHEFLRPLRKDFEAAWNGAVKANPKLGVGPINL